MKLTRSFGSKLVAWSVALAFVAGAAVLPAQVANPGSAKVIRVKGAARYTTGDNKWHPLKEGDVLKAGAVVQTASGSKVDLLLSDREQVSENTIAPAFFYRPVALEWGWETHPFYRPGTGARVNFVRMYENTVLAVDKLTWLETGADKVTETQLDLRAGRIFGTVKKLSKASRYEVKIPNGVAGIRGTIYLLDASGVLKVLAGEVVVSYVKPDGTTVTQVVHGGQMFDPVTGQITDILEFDRTQMIEAAKEAGVGLQAAPTAFTVDNTIYYVSPTIGFNGP